METRGEQKMYYYNYFVERSVIFLNVDKLAVPTTTQHNEIQVNDEDDVSRHRDCSVHYNKEWHSTIWWVSQRKVNSAWPTGHTFNIIMSTPNRSTRRFYGLWFHYRDITFGRNSNNQKVEGFPEAADSWSSSLPSWMMPYCNCIRCW